MKKDQIDNLFKNLEDSFNLKDTPMGHQNRFLDKLNSHNKIENNTVLSVKKLLSIAAILAVIITISGMFLNTNVTAADLASVSPEMEQTQSFFTNTINKELRTLKGFNDPETEALVQDALRQLDILENTYEILKQDLVESGNDKRVIYAMISNFQSKIDLLEQVIDKIEEVKNLNTKKNENII